jgi:AraC-like DNA-binding protein
MAVKGELEKLGISPRQVELGEVAVDDILSPAKLEEIRSALELLGFELIDDKKSRIIEKIKSLVIELIHHNAEHTKLKYSEYISGHLNYDYPHLSKLFSEVEGITIEQYIISQKIEKVKELLVYDEMSLSQIADKLGYSSVAHLSAQFKKTTGLTPSFFKNLGIRNRKPLDEVGKQ